MKRIFLFLAVSVPLISSAQIACPAFGRNQHYERWEVLLTWNSVDPYANIQEFDLGKGKYLLPGTFEDKSIAPGITFKYYPDDITALRLKTIYTVRNIHDHRETVDTTGHQTIYDEQFDQVLIKGAPGLQWTYFVSRFSFYGGFELPFTYHGDLTQTEYVIDTIPQVSRTETNATYTIPGGFSAGVGFFIGSTLYYRTLLGVGFEISSAYQYTKAGGTATDSYTVTGAINDSRIISYDDTIEHFRFTPLQASIHLSLRF